MLNLTPEETEFLNATSTCHLATVDTGGQPHVVPVRAAWDGTSMIFTTGLRTKKYRNLKGHPKAALSVGDFTRRAGVLLQGNAELIERGDEFVRTQQYLIDRGMMRRLRQEGEEAVVRG
ncbi:MAG TPA: pyridoxamine 5'-phosphate oxidase family protein, partial [Dehalococcoidia bacterium]|nr:pyridoxamine 5'-phosphate oxidase family protein [Dehalococcoidia bacterium]